MIALTLHRTERTADGTFGTLEVPGTLTVHTMEDDWRDNAPRESCIPAGTYTMRRTIYHKTGVETFEVVGVPGRSRILIHPANTEEDVEGCIGVGLRRGRLWVADEDAPGHPLTLKHAVVASQDAFRRLMSVLSGVDEASLSITEAFP